MRSDIIIGWEVVFEDIKNLFIEKDENGNKKLEDDIDELDVDYETCITPDYKWSVLRFESNNDDEYQWYISYYNEDYMSVSDMLETMNELKDCKLINTLQEYLRKEGVNPEICEYDNMGVYSVITNFYHD